MNKIIQYLKDSKTELKKVLWPTKKETFNYTVAIVGISLIVALFIGLIDFAFTLALQATIK